MCSSDLNKHFVEQQLVSFQENRLVFQAMPGFGVICRNVYVDCRYVLNLNLILEENLSFLPTVLILPNAKRLFCSGNCLSESEGFLSLDYITIMCGN